MTRAFTRTQSALALGGLIVGASLVARQMRRRRAIDFENRVVMARSGARS